MYDVETSDGARAYPVRQGAVISKVSARCRHEHSAVVISNATLIGGMRRAVTQGTTTRGDQ